MSFIRTKNILSRRWLNVIDGRVIESHLVNQRSFQSHCFRQPFQALRTSRLVPSGITMHIGSSFSSQQKQFSTNVEGEIKISQEDRKKEGLKKFFRLLQNEGGLDLQNLLADNLSNTNGDDLDVRGENEREDSFASEDDLESLEDMTLRIIQLANSVPEYEDLTWDDLTRKDRKLFETAFVRDLKVLKEGEFWDFLRACVNLKYEWQESEEVKAEIYKKIVELYGNSQNKEQRGLYQVVYYMGLTGVKRSDLSVKVWEILDREFERLTQLPEYQKLLNSENIDASDLSNVSSKSINSQEGSPEEIAAFFMGFHAIVMEDEEEDLIY